MTPSPSTVVSALGHLVGSTIEDRYRLDAVIGVGGMGAVFRAHHLGLKRDVAIKVLHPHITENSELAARFDREARSLARLEHPNCLQVTDFGSTAAGLKYLVMQFLVGHELTTLLGEPMAPERAATLAIQILSGLEHAHGEGIVHRDLKPENVFVTRDHGGRELLKLVDFGIAKIVEGADKTQLTRAGLVFGTPHYMSPEQAIGSSVDHRTDIYSAGVMLYFMLAGRLPFEGDQLVDVLRRHIGEPPPPLPIGIPVVVQDLVYRMLAKQPDARPGSAREVRKVLERFIASRAAAKTLGYEERTVAQPVRSRPSILPSGPSAAKSFMLGKYGAAAIGTLALVAIATWAMCSAS